MTLSKEIFLSRLLPEQLDRYDYSEAVYTNIHTRISIKCKNCCKVLSITPHSHIRGLGCSECFPYIPKKSNLNEFIDRGNAKWNSKYSYKNSVYVNSATKLEITCDIHGPFWKSPNDHLKGGKFENGGGCPSCHKKYLSYIKTTPWSEVYSKLTDKQLAENDYSDFVYKDLYHKSFINCVVHGPYLRNMATHLKGHGCQKCRRNRQSVYQSMTKEEFVKRASAIWPDRDFTRAAYVHSKQRVDIVCPIHGVFSQIPNSCLLKNDGCNGCSSAKTSTGELALANFVKSLGFNVLTSNRTLLNGLELDIVIPDKLIAIEYNGLYFHSDALKVDSKYHLNKTLLSEKAGYRLIHIYEDEWLNSESIVKSRLSHILNAGTVKRLGARKLKIINLTQKEASIFLNETHIQGYGKPPTYLYGLLDNTELVACMTFCPDRFKNSTDIELLRFSSKYAIQGGFSRLLKTFIRDNNYTGNIISFSDKRWSVGEVYKSNGFKLQYTTKPGYDYIKGSVRFNRQTYMKHKLPGLLPKFDPNLTEVENCKNNNIFKIWNCGMDKWVLKVD